MATINPEAQAFDQRKAERNHEAARGDVFDWNGHRVKVVGPREHIDGGTVVPVRVIGGHLDGYTFDVLPEQLHEAS